MFAVVRYWDVMCAKISRAFMTNGENRKLETILRKKNQLASISINGEWFDRAWSLQPIQCCLQTQLRYMRVWNSFKCFVCFFFSSYFVYFARAIPIDAQIDYLSHTHTHTPRARTFTGISLQSSLQRTTTQQIIVTLVLISRNVAPDHFRTQTQTHRARRKISTWPIRRTFDNNLLEWQWYMWFGSEHQHRRIFDGSSLGLLFFSVTPK